MGAEPARLRCVGIAATRLLRVRLKEALLDRRESAAAILVVLRAVAASVW